MKKFFFSHPDVILAIIAFILLAGLVSFFSWGINDVVFEVHQSIAAPASQSEQDFNLQGAAQLGLPSSTANAPAATAPAPTPVVTQSPNPSSTPPINTSTLPNPFGDRAPASSK